VFAGQTTIGGGGSRHAAAHRIVDAVRKYLLMLDKMGVPKKTFGDATEPLSEV
jgi:hypothetical protein